MIRGFSVVFELFFFNRSSIVKSSIPTYNTGIGFPQPNIDLLIQIRTKHQRLYRRICRTTRPLLETRIMDVTNQIPEDGGSTMIITDETHKHASLKISSSRHRFNTRLSFMLTITTLVLLGFLSVLYGNTNRDSSVSTSLQSHDHYRQLYSKSNRWLEDANDDTANNDDDGGDYSRYSCRYIYDQVSEPEDLCNYATTCNDGQGVWAPWVFCSSRMGIYGAFAVLSPIAMLWMVTLFLLLGSTAENFFSCSLEMFSLKLGLPPRFAGVTLLALGNGAADVSATISAIVSDEENGYKLSLGALTGAAMLVGGVVSGVVVLAADGVKCRGALIRDVMALIVTIAIVWISLLGGVVTRATTTMFLRLYGVFVCLVLAADIYHRAVVLPRMQAIAAAVANAEQDGERLAGNVEGLNSNPESAATTVVPPPNAFMRVVTSLSNYDNTFVTTAAPNTIQTEMQQQQPDQSVVGGSEIAGSPSPSQQEIETPRIASPTTSERAAGTSPLIADDEPFPLHGQNGILSGNSNAHVVPSSNLEMTTDDGGGHYTLVEDHIDRVCVGEGSPGMPSYNWTGACQDGKQEISLELAALWNEISSGEGELKPYERFFLLCELPFTLLRKVCAGEANGFPIEA